MLFPIACWSTSAQPTPESEYSEKVKIRDQLKEQQQQIQSEKLRCEKQKKNWTIATVVGGVGVVGTGIGAIVQHNKIQDQKKTKSELQKNINDANRILGQ